MSSFIFANRRNLAKLENDIALIEIDLDEYIATPLLEESVAVKQARIAVQKAQIAWLKAKRDDLADSIAKMKDSVVDPAKKMKGEDKNGTGP